MTTKAIEARQPRHLLARLMEAPDLVQAVQQLEPQVLHQLVRTCGLEECGAIVAAASAEQLMHVFDHDLWRTGTVGQEDRFDPDRFGVWLEVLVDAGVGVAAQKLVEMDFDFVTAAISQHIFVLGPGATIHGRDVDDWGADFSVGGYRIIARRGESWDALLAVLVSLDEDHPDFFRRLMARCFHISTDYVEDNGIVYDVMTADEQIMSDAAFDREQRREEQGYVTPSQAVAFLEASRRSGFASAAQSRDYVTTSYFRGRDRRQPAGPAEAGIPQFTGPLLPGETTPGGGRLASLAAQMRFVRERDGSAYLRRIEELGYLANVLIAGCSFNARQFEAVEASEAAGAVCNLGLENWRGQGESDPATLPPDFLVNHDLVTVFRAGWALIHEGVSLYAGRRLVEILSDLACDDTEVQEQLMDLAELLKRQTAVGTPWRARDSLDVVAILDTPAWATLLGVLDECPVVPAADAKPVGDRRSLKVSSDVEFISENRQIAWARDFVDSLADRLSG